MEENQEDRIKELEAKIKKLEKLMLKKEMEVDYLDKVADLAKEKLNIDVRQFADKARDELKKSNNE